MNQRIRESQVGTIQYRTLEIEKRAVDANERTVELAFASATPVKRWWWIEVLDMSGCDLTRLNNGGAFLLNHNTNQQIGVVVDRTARVDADNIARASVRFSKGPLGEEIMQDVADGIRRLVSVGYIVREEKLVATEEDVDTWEVRKWEPVEISIVPVPADTSVGVGRSLEKHAAQAEQPLEKRHVMNLESQTQPAPVPPSVLNMETDRQAQITRFVDTFKQTNPEFAPVVAERASEALCLGRSFEEFRNDCLTAYRSRPTAPPVASVTLTRKEQQRYSIARAILAGADEDRSKAGFELEISDEIGKQIGRQTRGFFVPMRWDAESNYSARALNSQTTGEGKELVYTQPGEFITLLRNAMKTVELGIRVVTGLAAPVEFARQTTGTIAYWRGEQPAGALTSSQMAFDRVIKLSPRSLQAKTAMTRQELVQASQIFDLEMMVREDLMIAHGLAADRAVIAGTGTGDQPKGVLYVDGVNVLPLGTNGAVPTYADLIKLKTAVNKANASMLGVMAFLTTPDVQGLLETTQKFAGTNGMPIWEDDKIAGYKAASTNQVPADLVKGSASNCHGIIFGAWNQILMGMFGTFEMLTDPYALKDQAMIEVNTFEMLDIAVRYPQAFAVIKDALIA